MSERATKTFETPNDKIKVVINASMNGGEMMDLEEVGVGAGIKSVDGRSGEISMAAGNAYKKRLRKLADIMIVSIGEQTEAEVKWSALRAMSGQDYSFVMQAVEMAASGIGENEGKS